MQPVIQASRWRVLVALTALASFIFTGYGGISIAQDAETTVTLPEITLSVGESTTLDATIACAADGSAAFAITLAFDPAVLQVNSAEVGPYLGDQVLIVENVVDNSAGMIRLAVTVLGDLPAPESDILFTLDVIALADGETPLTITELLVSDLVGNPVDARGIGGAVTVGEAGSVIAIPGGIDGGWFQLYFTQPSDTTNFSGAPVEDALIRALDGAQQTIDAALYELNSQPITDALIRAHQRSVRVRIVTDGEFGLDAPDSTVNQLELAGIEVQSDGSRGAYMHDNFVVIDSQFVWTGSTDLTHEGIYKQNNNAILIRSSQLAQNFTTEFEELFAGQFGKTSPGTIPNPVVIVNGTQIETIFESEGDAASRLATLFNQAQSVRFLAFSFTESLEWTDQAGDHSVMDLLRDRAESGQVDLKGIVDVTSRRFIAPLFCAGLDVRQDGNTLSFLHHKVFIIDESIAVTGSFNFSSSAANDNDENMLIIHNPDMAQAYLGEFDQQWAKAEQIPASEISCNG